MGLRFKINPDLHSQRITANLDGARYTFTFFYVRRAGGWFFHLDDSEGTRILSGVRVVSIAPLLKPYQSRPGVPPGLLHLVPVGEPRDPERDELGTIFPLYYWFQDSSLQASLP